VAGVSFAFDPSQPSGSRVAEHVVKVGDEYLQRDLKYRLAVKQYLHSGNDGFTMLPTCKILVSRGENTTSLSPLTCGEKRGSL
jgi:5'-nucleotidase